MFNYNNGYIGSKMSIRASNAYGFIFMVNEFGVKPLFKGMDEQIKNAIMERVEYLIKTEYI